MRGVEGFGVKHHLHTDRLLTLSEDLPMVSVAVDRACAHRGACSTRSWRSRATGSSPSSARACPPPPRWPTCTRRPSSPSTSGRGERADGRPAYAAVVDTLHRHGVAGATVLLGVDGTVLGERRRARFFAANAQVPLMVVAVGAGARIVAALAEVRALLAEPLLTLERVRVCKRDGRRLALPEPVAAGDPSGLAVWQKLMVYCGEQSRHAQRPLY